MLAWELCMDVPGYEVMQGIPSKGCVCFLAASLSHRTVGAWCTVNMDISLATRTMLRLRQLTKGLWQDDSSREECMYI